MAQHEIQRLRAIHYKMVDLVLAGLSTKEIAEECERTPQSISLVTNSPLFQDEVARRRKVQNVKHDEASSNVISRVKQILENNAEAAANVHVDLMTNSSDPRIKQSSANSILDRVYPAKVDEGSKTPVVQINVQQLQLLQLALAESV